MMLGLGGLIGFLSSGSTVSLVAGGGAGAFLTFVGYCSYNEYTQSPVTSKLWPALSLGALGTPYRFQRDVSPTNAGFVCVRVMLAGVSGALTVVMGNRFNKTQAFFPAGFLCASSAAMSIFYVWVLTKKPKHSTGKKE
jgi:uncharacterized membrane protein (UPF0136 family)